MSDYEKLASAMVGPFPGSATATDTRPPQRIAGTGTTEATLTYPLQVGQYATLRNGNAAIRFRLASATGLLTQVATTDPVLAANERHDWLVTPETCVPYVEQDGAAAFECWAWTSSK